MDLSTPIPPDLSLYQHLTIAKTQAPTRLQLQLPKTINIGTERIEEEEEEEQWRQKQPNQCTR